MLLTLFYLFCNGNYYPKIVDRDTEEEISPYFQYEVIPILLPACDEYEDYEGMFDDEHRKFYILVKTDAEKEEMKFYIEKLKLPPIPNHDEYYEEYYERLKATSIYSFEEIERKRLLSQASL